MRMQSVLAVAAFAVASTANAQLPTAQDSDNPPIVVMPASSESAIQFAAQELAEYLRAATGDPIAILPPNTDLAHVNDSFKAIRLELGADSLPTVADPELDDAISIEVNDKSGTISGTNPRAVLLAVYRYLQELGFRWVRPGVDGEFIPKLSSLPPVSVHEAASYRHRGICIEGINSVEHVQALIDWMPKLGFNSYFIQFEQAYTFFDRWYAHDLNPNIKGEHPSVEQCAEFVRQIEGDVERRGMLYHKVGHGWTCLPFGIEALGWEQIDTPPPPDVVPFLAEVKGKRDYWGKTPLNTNLCYSNPEVRNRVTSFIADYAQANPTIDYLHVWLADDSNNHCECAECRKLRPSDWYVRMLNELDSELSARNLPTHIVFLIYFDLLWPPVHESLSNPGRFVLMFAPYTRSYTEAFRPGTVNTEIPQFALNELSFPREVDDNVSFLRAWQKQFVGDSFDYDYHIFAEHSNLSQMQLANVVYEDMKNLKDLGLNGNVSCQPQRAFFPTGILMTIMGRTLWNRELGYNEMVDDYYRSAYGADGPACRRYMETLAGLYHQPSRRSDDQTPDKNAADMKDAAQLIEDFRPTILNNEYLVDPCHSRSWQILRFHADFGAKLIKAFQLRSNGDSDGALAIWNEAIQSAWDREPDLQLVFDPCAYADDLQRLFGSRRRN